MSEEQQREIETKKAVNLAWERREQCEKQHLEGLVRMKKAATSNMSRLTIFGPMQQVEIFQGGWK